jgi:UPF0716 family protein affecting phage T7 exclusion
MKLKSATFLALIGSVLLTALLLWTLLSTTLNVARGLVPAINLVSSLLYAFAALCVAVFFFVFHKSQP